MGTIRTTHIEWKKYLKSLSTNGKVKHGTSLNIPTYLPLLSLPLFGYFSFIPPLPFPFILYFLSHTTFSLQLFDFYTSHFWISSHLYLHFCYFILSSFFFFINNLCYVFLFVCVFNLVPVDYQLFFSTFHSQFFHHDFFVLFLLYVTVQVRSFFLFFFRFLLFVYVYNELDSFCMFINVKKNDNISKLIIMNYIYYITSTNQPLVIIPS